MDAPVASGNRPDAGETAGFAETQVAYRSLVVRRLAIMVLLFGLLLISFGYDVVTGSSGMSAADLLHGIFHSAELSPTDRVIIWNVRLPFALMAVLVGASLSLAGAEMQVILNNPLASPFTLGVASAAALGASTIIVFHLALSWLPYNWLVSLAAFVFAFGSVLLLDALSRLRAASMETMVLLGIALVFSCNAVILLFQLVATEDVLQQLVFWSVGSLARANWDKVAVLAIALVVIMPLSFASAGQMTALRMGEERAISFGIDVVRLRYLSLLRVSLLSAMAVAFVGTIGFIGLVGPHIARLLVGEDQRFALPASALIGALLLSLASIASKIVLPGLVVPVGIVTALVGVPVFVALIFNGKPSR
ncbi:iron chelate uptake ABC transporter family permease subunit [Rhizobium lusitanum]|uniref:Iron chelate uptake ABC transporter family permease subunit n=1 Tax=Rhizobium lusitanum TaxID=293958 RepID=A0A6L9U546_9HYPH|nr:iron ABC transporter permease [Rhizobium lusitanum]NEI69207.1 iron chelate uptake ABC transporter family permease subunit [Rhizobium lusitanum]